MARASRNFLVVWLVFSSLVGGFVVGFVVLALGFSWFRNTAVLVVREWDAGGPLVFMALSLVVATVVGACAGWRSWQRFLTFAERHRWLPPRAASPVHLRLYRTLGHPIWAVFGILAVTLLLVPPVASLAGESYLTGALAPSLTPRRAGVTFSVLAVAATSLTSMPVSVTLCVALLKRRLGISDAEMRAILGLG